MKSKVIKINSAKDFEKSLENTQEARSLGKEVLIILGDALLQKFYEALVEFYNDHQLDIETIEASGERVKACKRSGTAIGCIGGAIWGARIGGPYGAAAGFVLGGIGGNLLGYEVSHISITVIKGNNGPSNIVLSPA